MKTFELSLNLPGALADLPIAHLSQFIGTWAIEETHARQTLEMISTLDLAAHVKSHAELVGRDGFDRVGPSGKIAVVSVRGPMTKFGSSLSEDGSTIRARRAIRNATNDESVGAILLHIDSPGGTTAGTMELADDFFAAGQRKPTATFIEDLGASAAFEVASQGNVVSANPPALVGSIGTYLAISDFSRLAENAGIKVHVIRAGAFKGAGMPGTPITDEQLAEWQRIVNEINSFFKLTVLRGRSRMTAEQLETIADGRVHLAEAAKGLGLIDRVESLDQAIAALESRITRETRSMTRNAQDFVEGCEEATRQQQTPRPATLQDLKAACQGADSDFLLAQLEANATVDMASRAWMAKQSEVIEAQKKQLAEAEEARAKAEQKKPVHRQPSDDGVGTSTGNNASYGDAISEWKDRLNAHVKAGMTRQRAVALLTREDPDLAQRYRDEYTQRFPIKTGKHAASG